MDLGDEIIEPGLLPSDALVVAFAGCGLEDGPGCLYLSLHLIEAGRASHASLELIPKAFLAYSSNAD
jgi:hypothetical protein